ncbi:MAG: type II toxin-antitoxin system PemK/MazF family toxin [Dehalococcoidia bacterium]
MLRPGTVVWVDFPGAVAIKRRPAVVVSTDEYHRTRPDCVLALVTSNVQAASTRFDHLLDDWRAAGLRRPSAVRAYYTTVLQADVQEASRLSARDWAMTQARLAGSLSLP